VHSKGKNIEKYSWINDRTSLLTLVRLLRRELLVKADRIVKLPKSDVLFCGGSANNEREFIFLADTLSEYGGLTYSKDENFSFLPHVNLKRSWLDRVIAFLVFFVSCLYLVKIKIRPVSIKYLLYFGRIYLRVYFSFAQSPWLPKILVVANDHTDLPVAAAMVAKLFRCRLIYVQHAEVTGNFPALDFDISVLRNEKALDVYRCIGEVRGDIYIIPRDKNAGQAVGSVLSDMVEPVHVVIYLSSVFSSAGLANCIDALKLNKCIEHISIKAHPRGALETLAGYGVEVLFETPSFKHVAVVANSSVAIELLGAGVKVFQCFMLDEIPRDYYGFVAERVVSEVIPTRLSERFWNNSFYDEQWITMFAKYSPAVRDNWMASLPLLQNSINRFLK
jgi:hypothetical protein